MKFNSKAIQNFLTLRYNPEDKITHNLSWKNFTETNSDPNGTITENLLDNSIQKNFSGSNKPLVISLSGGLDSTLLLSLVRKSFPERKIIAVCGIFEDTFDESLIASKIAKKFDVSFRVIQMGSIFENMPEIIYIAKKPRWNTYHHLIAKEAKKFGDVLITGDAADELFGGYSFRYRKFLNLLQQKDNWKNKTINYLECHNRDWVHDQEKIFGSRIKFDWDKVYRYFKPYFNNPLNPLKQVLLADFNGKLMRDFIPMGMAIGEHYHIKIVTPFMDEKLFLFASHLPFSEIFENKSTTGKVVLRKISRRNGINHIEEKKGFSPELLFDWKKNGKEICKNYLQSKKANIFEKKIIDYNWVNRAFERIENDGDIRYLYRLISILALEIWYRLFITNELSNKTKL